MKKFRIMIIDDNRMLRDGIAAILNAQPDLKVVASGGSTEVQLQKIQTSKPHVVLIDAGLRNQNGLRSVRTISKAQRNVKVVGMGLIPSQSDVVEFVEAGAAGFVLKDATASELLATIRSAAQGIKVMPPQLTGSLFSHVVDHALKEGKGILRDAVRMTKREREVVELIAEGLSNKEISQRLNVATHTVKSHVHNILEKLALHSRLQIAAFTHNEARE